MKLNWPLKYKIISVNVLTQLLLMGVMVILLARVGSERFLEMKKESTRAVIEGQVRQVNTALARTMSETEELAKNETIVDFATSGQSEAKALSIIDSFMIGTGYANVYLMNLQGEVILSVDPSFMGNNFAFRQYFTKPLSGESYMQMAFGVLTKKQGYYFGAPVKDGEEIVGVLAIKTDVSYIENLFVDSATKRIGHYFMTDEHGVVISSDKEIDGYQSLGTIKSDVMERIVRERRFEGFEIKPLQYQVAQDIIDNYTESTEIEYDDIEDGEEEGEVERELLQIMRIGQTPFYLVTETSLSIIYAQIAQIIAPVAALMIAVALVIVFVQSALYRKMFAPLSQLEKYVSQIASQKDPEPLSIDSNDELELLANSLQSMVGKIKDVNVELEQKVAEKTAQITAQLEEFSQNNSKLRNNEIAIMNLLEDSKDLEKALEEEKKSVELKVVERTKELNNEQAKLMASITALPGLLIIVDAKSKMMIQNGKLNQIFGTNEKEWSLAKIHSMLGEEFDLRTKLGQVLNDKQTFDVAELAYQAKFLKIFIAPVYNKDKEIIGALMTVNDITEAKVLERSKDEFFSIASHELRTPLTAIRGNTSMIMDYYKDLLKDKQVREIIEDTHTASVRLIEIVNDFLDISRLEQGRMEYKLEPTALKPILDKIVTDFATNAHKEGVELKVEGDAGVIANIDSGKFEQIAINLVGNALKFTEKGQITLSLEKKAKAVLVTVTDTGAGIPKANQGLLFHKFQQAGSSILTRDGAKGTGLGLYISRLMAEGMGGKLELIASEEGKGSKFGLTLPNPEGVKANAS